jgi:hypothetical protein
VTCTSQSNSFSLPPSSHPAIPYPLSTQIQVLVRLINRFPTPPIKLKLGLQVGGRLLIATYLDQSNYIANRKRVAVNKYNLIVFIRLFPISKAHLKCWAFLQGPINLPMDSLDSTNEPHSSKIYSTWPHTENWWRCSNVGLLKCGILFLGATFR